MRLLESVWSEVKILHSEAVSQGVNLHLVLLSDLLLRITRNMLAASHTRLARQHVVMEASTRALVLVALAVESVL